jgi:hypothetical protein
VLEFFEWSERSALGSAIANSIWAFPVIQSLHLLGLSLLGGALLVVDLRLLGVGLRTQRIQALLHHARPWLIASVVVLLVTGVLLFFSEAVKLYYNTSFWVKITTLPVALVFTFMVRNRLAREDTLETSARTRFIGAASITLWFTVAAAGRWIGFS